MKKFLVAMGVAAFAFVGCGDDSSSSGPNNDEQLAESSSSGVEPAEDVSSSSVKAKSSSSKEEKIAEESSSSVKPESSSVTSSSSDVALRSSSSEVSESSSSSADVQSSSSETAVSSSSSVREESSSSLDFDWSLPKETYLNPEIEYDTIIDSRDGKVYRTVKIGDQTWMAENLNYDPGQGGSDDAKYDWSWCYNNDPKNCDVAGRLYTWAAAMDSAGTWSANGKGCGYGTDCSPTDAVRGICPAGWHLPTNPEWEMLFTAVGGDLTACKVLKSQTGWFSKYNNGNGTDSFGFSALPAGYRDDYDGSSEFWNGGRQALFWSNAEYNSLNADYMLLDYYNEWVFYHFNHYKNYGLSVRCLKDAE
ncbi:MAG: fibrobacter succinogenes major paralogous domain-containing protein [Fibrobacter sp.]|nr:fibrobacter succinogenes major paralogous domain-containing protein [Fibrobacter sp.]